MSEGVLCTVCPRGCVIRQGHIGFCGGRANRDGEIIAENYGKVTSIALDPIEKKPLRRFRPGSLVLSVGSYGCNLRCSFCQNYRISMEHSASGCIETTP
ncbi:MAG: radical SAM protein, partial [Anaerovoracaceae bacterium]